MVKPGYSYEAREAGVQGMVGLSIIVDESGKATNIEVVSPLGYGLDERAVEAVKQWEFSPGRKDGKPVKVRATVQVTFRASGRSFLNAIKERRRSTYNFAKEGIQNGEDLEKNVDSIRQLAEEGYGPAMVTYADLIRKGTAQGTPEEANQWTLKAAEDDEASALLRAAQMYLSGAGTKQDFKKGRKLAERAAKDHDDVDAQYFLGRSYEDGSNGFDEDTDDAVKYYQMCGSATMLCQLGAGRSLLHKEKRRDKDLAEAVAWLELAAGQDSQEARDLLAREVPELSDELRKAVEERKAELAAE